MELPLSVWQNGTSALAIAKRLGYISVIDVLKLVTEETVSMVRSSEMLPSPLDTMLALCGHDTHMEVLSQCFVCDWFPHLLLSSVDNHRETSHELSRNSG